MKITPREYAALTRALVSTFKYVSVEEAPNFGERFLTFGGNWAAIGTAEPEAAMGFTQDVKKAAKVAYEMTRLDLEVDYDLEEKLITDKEAYDSFIWSWMDSIRIGRTEGIKTALENNGHN